MLPAFEGGAGIKELVKLQGVPLWILRDLTKIESFGVETKGIGISLLPFYCLNWNLAKYDYCTL